MRKLFEAKGELAQWKTIYLALTRLNVGDVITDIELAALLPDAGEGSVRTAFHRALREVEATCQRTFTRVRGVGYRVVAAREHEFLARAQHKRAKRRLAAAHSKAHSADRSQLTSDERRRLDAVEDHLVRQQEMVSRLGERLQRAELRTARTEKDQLRLADRVDRLAELLARHGISDDDL